MFVVVGLGFTCDTDVLLLLMDDDVVVVAMGGTPEAATANMCAADPADGGATTAEVVTGAGAIGCGLGLLVVAGVSVDMFLAVGGAGGSGVGAALMVIAWLVVVVLVVD